MAPAAARVRLLGEHQPGAAEADDGLFRLLGRRLLLLLLRSPPLFLLLASARAAPRGGRGPRGPLPPQGVDADQAQLSGHEALAERARVRRGQRRADEEAIRVRVRGRGGLLLSLGPLRGLPALAGRAQPLRLGHRLQRRVEAVEVVAGEAGGALDDGHRRFLLVLFLGGRERGSVGVGVGGSGGGPSPSLLALLLLLKMLPPRAREGLVPLPARRADVPVGKGGASFPRLLLLPPLLPRRRGGTRRAGARGGGGEGFVDEDVRKVSDAELDPGAVIAVAVVVRGRRGPGGQVRARGGLRGAPRGEGDGTAAFVLAVLVVLV